MVEIYINNYIIVAFMNILSIVILMVCSSLIVAMEVDEVNLTPYITEFIVPFNTPT
jgi:nicotinamide riboside transporter PnuC